MCDITHEMWGDSMQMDSLAEKIFETYATASRSRYIFLRNMKTNRSRWSPNAVDFFGLPGEYMEDAFRIFSECIHPEDRESVLEDMERIYAGEKDEHNMEYRAKGKDGNYVVCLCKAKVIRDESGEAAYFAGVISNHGIIDNIDPTTSLYNLYEFLHALQLIRETKKEVTILMLGIKRFADINDVYGYSFGNKVLKEFSQCLRNMCKGRAVVYRMDGAKFAVCAEGFSHEDVVNLNRQIHDIAKRCIYVDGNHVTLVTCGSAVEIKDFAVDENTIYSGLRFALERSKNEKHGELIFFEGESHRDNKRNLELMDALRKSITDKCAGFYMCYQPVVDAVTGKVRGMEALVRWKKEPFGEVPPGVFIPLLENDALFFELGNWILKESLLAAKKLVKLNPEFILNVNISYTQLERSEFRNSVIRLLEETDFPPQNLCLELTERCRLLDMSFLRNEVIFLKSFHIKIALDDFGTGFSSLNLLRELPVDLIKIDRAFIKDIETNLTDQAIVKSVLDCAKLLDISVCVEGIENKNLESYMNHYPASTYQGYLYSRPVKIEQFEELIK